MQQQKSIKGLLPAYFKIVGLVLIVLAFVPMLVMKALDVQLNSTQKDWYRLLTMDVFILGLLFIAWSRDKFEDDSTIALRLKTMSFSFMFGVFTVIIDPISSLLFGLSEPVVSGQKLVVTMLLFYLGMYYLQKKLKRPAED